MVESTLKVLAVQFKDGAMGNRASHDDGGVAARRLGGLRLASALRRRQEPQHVRGGWESQHTTG